MFGKLCNRNMEPGHYIVVIRSIVPKNKGCFLMYKKIVLLLLFALLVAIFSIQNANLVLIRFLKWDFEIYLVLIVFGAIVFGTILMTIVNSVTHLKLSKKIRLEKKQKEELLRELEHLRREYQELFLKTQENLDEENHDENNSENNNEKTTDTAEAESSFDSVMDERAD